MILDKGIPKIVGLSLDFLRLQLIFDDFLKIKCLEITEI